MSIKLFLPLLILVGIANAVDSAENSAGVDSSFSKKISGFLTAKNTPYIIEETIVIEEGEALVIDKNVEMRFKEGTGIDVRGGTLSIEGDDGESVTMRPLTGGTYWNGISVTGNEAVDLNYCVISGAKVALAIENGNAEIRNAEFLGNEIGIYSKSGKVDILNSMFSKNSGAAIYASANSALTIDGTYLENNNVGLFANISADVSITSSKLSQNSYAVLDIGNNTLREFNTKIEGNRIGIIGEDIPLKNFRSVAQNNGKNIAPGASIVALSLPEAPKNEYASRYTKASLNNNSNKNKEWTLSGNVSSIVGYHLVRTRHNHTGSDFISDEDTVKVNARYKNYSQIPGLFSGLNTYLKLESQTGRSLEFSADLSSDTWDNFKLNSINLTYTDSLQRISLGDSYVSAGELYLSGVNLFGIDYSINLFKTSGVKPMFEVEVFAGEKDKPKLVGEKNEDVYKDWIEDGEAEPQTILAGGHVTWNMHRRFNGTLGFIGGKDYLEDPFLRDGQSANRNIVDPMITSRTFFADGNWTFWPGDIELNGQIAAGGADTVNVWKQRAINEVFSAAGISVSNFTLLRKLMQNKNLVSALTNDELNEIFGDNQTMSPSEKRAYLRTLLEEAKKAEKSYVKSEDDQANVSDWDGQNLAASGSLAWSFKKTKITAHLKLVGSKFYSAGSPDALNNYREFGASLNQGIFDFWTLSIAYDGSVENASNENKYNVFGLGEGTTWGLFQSASSDWDKKHEQDADRALFVHDATLKNIFKISKNIELALKYKADYRQRNRSTRLYANYSAESGIYEDSWFKGSGSDSDLSIISGDDTLYIDSNKFAKYYALSDEEYLATGFQERLLKHIVEAELSLKLPNNVLKIGGSWTYRTDLSKFEEDNLLDGFDFSNKTYGKLGYYFHGADYFEQKYPISLVSDFSFFKNRISFTPRYKTYNRDSMKEFEWNVSETFEKPIVKDFLELSLNGDIRQEFVYRHSEGDNETEADFDASATLRMYYTHNFYSDYTLGAFYNYRPDSREDEYKDFYGMFTLNYDF